ncbi:hypothetical protein M0R45_026096 [Rubus argutus]|uniref:Zinc finger protein n=1 Tax=Rubus argutus TaxID=59490 RepID=A0AAW1WW20_RUBAR
MVQLWQRTTQEMVIDEGSELDDGAALVNRDGICDGRDDATKDCGSPMRFGPEDEVVMDDDLVRLKMAEEDVNLVMGNEEVVSTVLN